MNGGLSSWDARFREGEYPAVPEPSVVLCRFLDACPEGRALDVATGTGRNALYLAAQGYVVDAVDYSRAGLEIARENARDRSVADRINWVQADIESYGFPEACYDLITISFYRAVDRFPDIKAALKPGGVLFVQHHLRTNDETVDVGPDGDRYRFAANELLHACLDLTVLYYGERIETRDDGCHSAITEIVARNTKGQHQSYPSIDWK